MINRLIRVAIIAAALLITALLVPDIEVEWSDGTTTTANGVAANQIVTLAPATGAVKRV